MIRPHGRGLDPLKKRFTEEQIAFALRQAESGVPVQEVCRKMGVTDPSTPLRAGCSTAGRRSSLAWA
jgi:putative transposase